MNQGHVTEEQLQDYAIDATVCDADVRRHIASCAKCQNAAAGYRTLFNAIRQQPAPVFDFDVAEVVLPALPHGSRSVFPYLMGVLLIAATGFPIYLFRYNLANLFGGISHFFLYASIGAALMCLVIGVGRIIKGYRQEFEVLDNASRLQHFPGKTV